MNLCILQARMDSTRLPKKVLKKINGIPLLHYEINRLRQAKRIHKIVVATGDGPSNDILAEFCKKTKIPCFRGSELDVLDRYYQCSLNYPRYKNIVRITGDCPLIDPEVIDQVIQFFEKNRYDYASNVILPTYPDGMDVEIFTKTALAEAAIKAKLNSEREHVTPYIKKSKKNNKGNFSTPHNFSHFRLTVDEPEDLRVIKFLIQNSSINDGYLRYISLLTQNPHVMFINMNIPRNQGYLRSLKND